jgi:hypothetical protein
MIGSFDSAARLTSVIEWLLKDPVQRLVYAVNGLIARDCTQAMKLNSILDHILSPFVGHAGQETIPQMLGELRAYLDALCI